MYQIIIFGPPGTGKGTQAEKIASKLNLFHLSTGEYLRKAVEEGTELGKKAKVIMDKGNLVSDEIMIGIVKEALTKNMTEGGFILDGFPRTIKQAEELDLMFADMKITDITIIYLRTEESELLTRLMNRSRSDDTAESIKHRFTIYNDTTKPILNYFKNRKYSILEINGFGPIEDVYNDIASKM